ncbi:hypothetical protein IVA79_02120 [Bradyrhizobium sp. 138]|uniref:hypothetical protein n=1 Tax=Bradyrhizobium sp. 138 TaxID=2782615 RepID=UPI001FFAAA4E|nr:hypothetical protein [Bradyrhizobium sp. 138]MCK1732774.1 hypothetical protein [Bradyrhizobium sp. 138]
MPQTPLFKDCHACTGREMQKFWSGRALQASAFARKDIVGHMWQAYRSPSVEQAMSDDKNFDRLTLENALTELGRRAFAAGRTVEIVIYGGSALLLTMNRQINTGDVDAVFEGNKDFIKKLAAEIAEEFGWDENWLNDGVKGWLSKRDADPDVKALFKTYPTEDQPGLRVYTARPEYLFAMKCRAMRVGGVETNSDIDDIKLLARAIGIKNSQDALTLVEKFYPQNMLQPKTRLGLEEIFSNLEAAPETDHVPLSSQP